MSDNELSLLSLPGDSSDNPLSLGRRKSLLSLPGDSSDNPLSSGKGEGMGVQALTVPDDASLTIETLAQLASEFKTDLAACKVRLYAGNPILINEATTLAELTFAEATYDGYTAGGVAVANAGTPYLESDGNSYLVSLPSVQFNYSTATHVTANSILGAFVTDANGILRGVFPFPTAISMAEAGDAVVVLPTWRFGPPPTT